jgi:hypothetical protein
MNKLFLFKDSLTKENSTYCHYGLIGDPERQKRSPGFGAGLTLTVQANKIVGESVLIRLGDNSDIGKMFSTILTMNICYEALGKPRPQSEALTDSEVRAYAEAIERALAGAPQNIRYQGFPFKITLSRSKNSELLVAITPET